jgi:uncharacterized protein YcfJ
MNRVLGTTALALSLLAVTTQAFATPPHHRHDRHYYRTAREVPVGYDYADVVDVDPIVRQVRVEVPRKECFSEVQEVYTERRERVGPGPALVGGLIGGVIGNQFGDGRSRRVATAAGALIGASIANDTASRRATRYDSAPEERVVERCDVRYEQQFEERIDGYRVRYLYNGREYSTQLPYDPGDRIKIRVAVEPAE